MYCEIQVPMPLPLIDGSSESFQGISVETRHAMEGHTIGYISCVQSDKMTLMADECHHCTAHLPYCISEMTPKRNIGVSAAAAWTLVPLPLATMLPFLIDTVILFTGFPFADSIDKDGQTLTNSGSE